MFAHLSEWGARAHRQNARGLLLAGSGVGSREASGVSRFKSKMSRMHVKVTLRLFPPGGGHEGRAIVLTWTVASDAWQVLRKCMGEMCPFTLQPWVAHETDLFRNPVDIEAIDEAAAALMRSGATVASGANATPAAPVPHDGSALLGAGGRRNERSLIFPACQERGGLVAARVFAALRAEWGSSARATFAYYDQDTSRSDELQAIRGALRLGGVALGAGGRQVSIGTLSKADLLLEMQRSGFFVYGLVSSRGTVHYDTFASVVAEVPPPARAVPGVGRHCARPSRRRTAVLVQGPCRLRRPASRVLARHARRHFPRRRRLR